MQTSFWGYFIIVLGIVSITIAMIFQDVTTTNDQNYYLIKEITEASMIDAIDIAYYRKEGGLAIDKEKFVENFIRRYSDSTSDLFRKNYNIQFHDIVEMPPKVSVSVNSKSQVFSFTGEQFDIYNKLDAILETRNIENGFATS